MICNCKSGNKKMIECCASKVSILQYRAVAIHDIQSILNVIDTN